MDQDARDAFEEFKAEIEAKFRAGSVNWKVQNEIETVYRFIRISAGLAKAIFNAGYARGCNKEKKVL